jgi:hypothetical protein
VRQLREIGLFTLLLSFVMQQFWGYFFEQFSLFIESQDVDLSYDIVR